MNSKAADDQDLYEIVIAKYGTRTTVRSEVFLNYAFYHEPDGPIGMDYFIWVIRNTQKTILVDTGYSPEQGRMRGRTQLASIEELLTTLGIDPHAVADLILTHAHYDHAGNLDLFSNAQITVSHSEMEFWEGKNAGKTLFHHALDENGITALQRARSEGRLRTFNGSIEVAPGIEVLEVGGHTPGQCLVKVKTREGNVLLASDAVHYYEELEREMPFSSVADIVAMYDAFALIKELTASGEISSVISGHDPDTLSRFPQTFSTGPLSELFATIGGAS